MIGKVCTSVAPYYDTATNSMKFKSRPVLIIGTPDSGDYAVLPISRVTKSQYIDPDYDFPIDPAQFPLLHLTSMSYIRIHKQTVVNQASINQTLGYLKVDYEDTYLAVLEKLD
jgi:hypothetical protein